MQVVDVLDHATVLRSADGDEVEHREVTHHLAQADTTGMRAHGHAELRGQQQDREVLVDPAHPGGVDLHDVEGARLQHLLEDHPVLDVLTGGDQHGRHGLPDGGMPENVVRTGRLLDPERMERCELCHPRDRLRHVPTLVRVDRDVDVGTHALTRQGQAPYVVCEVPADLQLDGAEPVGHRKLCQPSELVVVVAQPSRAGGVRGISIGQQRFLSLGLASDLGTQEVEGLVGGEHVGQIAEVDDVDDLLRGQVCQQLPQGLPGALGLEVPQRVEHGAGRHVDDALLGAEPAQLRVRGELASDRAEVAQHRLHVTSEDPWLEGGDGHGLDVVAPSGREDEAMTLQAVVGVGAQHQVGGRVVRLRGSSRPSRRGPARSGTGCRAYESSRNGSSRDRARRSRRT